jgi:hypothetical protein
LDLSYSEDQILLRESAQRFLKREYRAGQVQNWSSFAELGWLALPFAEADGGLGGGAVETALLMQEFGAALVVEPYLSTVLLGGALLSAFGASGEILPALIAGQHKLAHAGAVTARAQSHAWQLEGRKTAVLGAPLANTLVVSAQVGDRVGLFTLPADAPGLDINAYAAVDGTSFADLTFAGAIATLLAEDASAAIEKTLDHATIALCADALGAITVLVDATVEYAKTRVQFGQPIGKFQALAHRMAEMAVLREEAGAAVLFAVLKADASAPERARATSAAKAKLGRCARFIGQQAVQIHGGMGVTEELNIGAYFKRLTVFELLLGNTTHHLRRYAALAASTDILNQSLVS